jgi:NAD+ synthase
MSNQEKETLFQEFVKKAGEFITPQEENVINAISIIQKELKNYIKKAGLKGLTLGVSGGLDSACCAAIVSPVCKELNIPLMGMFIPLSSSIKHQEQAQWVGDTFCDAYMEMNSWEDDFYQIGKTAHDMVSYAISVTDRIAAKAGFDTNSFERNIQQANIKSRLRMISLYDLAHKTQSMVIGTGNMSEDSILFFYTLGGDGQVDWSPIKTIGKGFELPVFAKVLNIREDIISQQPSDGLSASEADTDMAQIGLESYKEVDAIGFAMLGLLNEELIKMYEQLFDYYKVQIIINRYKRYSFKEHGEVFITRKELGL